MIIFLRNYAKICIFVSFSLFFSVTAKAQDKIAFGLSAAYNFPLQGLGIGLRVQIPIIERFYVVPEVRYFPAFNAIHEFYGGANIQYMIFEGNYKPRGIKRVSEPHIPNLYLTAGADYNRWINYAPSLNDKAIKDNFLPNIGIGTSIGNYAFQGFAELKYNIIWKESFAEVGFLVCPRYFKSKKKSKCPDIN